MGQITNSSTQIIYNYISDTIYNVKKQVNKIKQQQINKKSAQLSYLVENDIYSPSYDYYINIDISNIQWNFVRPIEYTNEFYDYFTLVHFPIVSNDININYNTTFNKIYPYLDTLYYHKNYNYMLNFKTNNYKSIILLKDIYLSEHVYDQKLLLPPISYTGQEGYKIFINKHELIYNKIQLSENNLLQINNSQYITNTPDDWNSNPKNLFYMFTPGMNRIIIEILYNKTNYNNIYNNIVDNKANLNLQFDLIINNKNYINSGLYTYNNKIKQKYMKMDNYQLQLINNTEIWISR